MSNRDEGPVYYREIQKNAYLKRIPNDEGSKLRPLGHKKPPLKAMWTLFCVHNGRTPFLEQYPGAEAACTLAHKPTWRACLRAARHVTASVKPRIGDEYDFLVDTDHGPVRMLAPDWDTMQDWVTCLRWKLQELKILPKGENVYCAPPAAPPPRAAARDPTSPLPPTPPVPPHRVPGIELITPVQATLPAPVTQEPEIETRTELEPERVVPEIEPVDISSWDTDYSSVPGTSHDANQREPKRSVTKICGQSICLDDSILKRTAETTDSDDEFFAEIDRIHYSAENLFVERTDAIEKDLSVGACSSKDVTERNASSGTNISSIQDSLRDRSASGVKDSSVIQNKNLTKENSYVIQDSVRDRVAVLDRSISLDNSARDRCVTQDNSIRDMCAIKDNVNDRYERLDEVTHNIAKGSKLEKLKLEDCSKGEGYKQRVVVNEEKPGASSSAAGSPQDENLPKNTNITVIQVSNKPPHTAIPVLGPETDVFDFEFKHKDTAQNSKNFVNIVNTEVGVKDENGYGTVFANEGDYGHISLTTTVNLTGDGLTGVKSTDVNLLRGDLNLSSLTVNDKSTVNSSEVNVTSGISNSNANLSNDNTKNINLLNDNEGIYERLCLASTSNTNIDNKASPLPVKKLKNQEKPRKSSLPNLESSDSTYEYLYPNSSTQHKTSTNVTLNTNLQLNNSNNTRNITIMNSRNNTNNQDLSRSNIINQELSRSNQEARTNESKRNIANENTRPNDNVHVNVTSTVSVGNIELNSLNLRSNVERSHSQNAYDNTPRLRDHLIRRVQHQSPKREGKTEKTEQSQAKPIWKRGLTELSLLSRLRGIGQGRRQESPTRNDTDRSAVGKVTRRARPEVRGDSSRRRSSSLNNGQSPPLPSLQSLPPLQSGCSVPLQSLRSRQAAALRADQRRGAAIAAHVPASEIKVFVDYNRQVWVAWWGALGSRAGGRTGDRVAAVRGVAPRDAAHARQLLKSSPTHMVDILFHRVPLAKIYVLNKRDLESIGIKLDSECNITSVENGSAAARCGLPPPGQWALTEVNNRPINLIKGGEEEMNRMSVLGTEVSVLLQPSALVKKIRSALKTHRSALSNR